MRRFIIAIALPPLLAISAAPLTRAAPPPLSPTQRVQLDAVTDGDERLDQGGWYPLLETACDWAPGDEAGATIPDYLALLADPAAHRGEPFLIEGRLARSQPVPTARSGRWGDTITEWVVVVRARTDAAPEEVAVVYLVSPDSQRPASPPVESPVRVPARFYKTWLDRDATGQPATYMTFVGRMPHPTATPAPAAPAWALPAIIVAGLVAFVWLRRLSRRDAAARGPRSRPRPAPAPPDAIPAPPSEALPDDPAAALDALRRGRDESQP